MYTKTHNVEIPKNMVIEELKKTNFLLTKLLNVVSKQPVTDAASEKFLTVNEAARQLKRSPATIRRMLRDGKIKGYKLNNGIQQDHYLIPVEEIEQLMEQRRIHHGKH
jgi:excisionase family DNA binding protein